MPDEIKPGEQPLNPDKKQDPPKPVETPKPKEDGTVAPNLEAKVVELTEKIEVLSRQYQGSSEEALRLKTERDELALVVTELKQTKTVVPQNDEELNDRIAKVGMAQAFQELIANAVKPFVDQQKKDLETKVETVLSTFKSKHPGLKDDILTRFDKEFSRLKTVYTDPNEAMEAAYAVIGGIKADEEATKVVKEVTLTKEQIEQSKVEHQQIIEKVSESGDDRQPVVVDPNVDATAKIKDLEATAIEKGMRGEDCLNLWTQIEELKQAQAKANASKTV